MSDHPHVCYSCHAPLVETARTATHKTLACESGCINNSYDIPLPVSTNTERQRRYRAKQKSHAGNQAASRALKQESQRELQNAWSLSGKLINCPMCPVCGSVYPDYNNCQSCHTKLCHARLVRVNLSETIARKGCPVCRRRFDFIRTDTLEGRSLRVKLWRKKQK